MSADLTLFTVTANLSIVCLNLSLMLNPVSLYQVTHSKVLIASLLYMLCQHMLLVSVADQFAKLMEAQRPALRVADSKIAHHSICLSCGEVLAWQGVYQRRDHFSVDCCDRSGCSVSI